MKSGYPEYDELEWSRPPTKAEVAGILFTRFLKWGALGLLLLAAVLTVVIGVPAMQVGKSDAYRAACDFVAHDGMVAAEIGRVQGFESSPTVYRLEPDRAHFTFVVRGEVESGVSDVWLARDGVWHVTSASFIAQREHGMAFRRILVRGEAAPVGSH